MADNQDANAEHHEDGTTMSVAQMVARLPDVKTMTRDALEDEVLMLRAALLRVDRRMDEALRQLDSLVSRL